MQRLRGGVVGLTLLSAFPTETARWVSRDAPSAIIDAVPPTDVVTTRDDLHTPRHSLDAVQGSAALQPSALEAFALRAHARTVWSQEIARIDSDEAHAVVTAIEMDDLADPSAQMSGIRIDLLNGTGADQVFVARRDLETLRTALNEIVRDMEHADRVMGSRAPYQYLGAALFWHPHGWPIHDLNAAFYRAPESSGLSLSAFGVAQEFRFPHRSPALLESALARSLEALKNKP